MKRSIPVKHYLFRDINAVIQFLIASDIIIVGAGGLLGPIFALFIEDFIVGGNAAVAGIAAAIYLLTKSLGQIPVAMFIDKIRGEKDDFYVMLTFSIITALLPLAYLMITTPLHLYIVQFFYGLATAMTFPSYMAIFTRHIDTHKEGTEWGVYFTLTDLSSAAFSAIGGYIAITIGFPALIMMTTALSLMGTLLLLPIKSFLRFKK
ncbi:MAG: MFS transporter [Patescibacteria group bacterium]|jgi:MFS family permease